MARKGIRILGNSKEYGEIYGITIPREIALDPEYKNTYFQIIRDGSNLTLESGEKLQ